MHGMSIEKSKIRTTETLMSLLDPNPRPNEDSNLDDSKSDEWHNISDEKVFPLSDDDEAVFWDSKPRRRHSIQVITKELVDNDVDESRRIPFQHLWHLDDLDALVDVYGADGIETYDFNGKQSIHIIKDFRKQVKPAYETDSEAENDATGGKEDEAPKHEADDYESLSPHSSPRSTHSASSISRSRRVTTAGGRRCQMRSSSACSGEDEGISGSENWSSHSTSTGRKVARSWIWRCVIWCLLVPPMLFLRFPRPRFSSRATNSQVA